MRLKKRKRNNAFILVIIIMAAAAISSNYIMLHVFYDLDFVPLLPEGPDYPVLPPSVEGYEMASVDTGPGVIYLKTECFSLDMVTTEQQAASIQNGIEGKVDFRPTAHDMASDILAGYRIDPLYVRVDRMESDIYFAKLILKSGDRVLTLDTRPTDAIGVAVRFGAPIYVKKELLETYGEDTC